MSDVDDVRTIAMSLAGVVDIDSDGFDFRVHGHGFVWSYLDYAEKAGRVIRTDIAVLYVGDEAEKQARVLGEPVTDAWHVRSEGYRGWPSSPSEAAALRRSGVRPCWLSAGRSLRIRPGRRGRLRG